MTKTALIVIDVQEDFLPGGALAVPDGDAIFRPVEDLMRSFDLVVLTQDFHPAGHKSFASAHADTAPFSVIEMPYGPQVLWPDHCVQGTKGADIRLPDDVRTRATLILRKGMNPNVDSYSAFMENDKETRTGLAGWLRDKDVERVVICGLAFDYCVAYSALDAVDAGFQVIIPLEATRAIADITRQTQMDALRAAGVHVCDTVAEVQDLMSAPSLPEPEV